MLRKVLSLFLIAGITFHLSAQRPGPDTFEASKGLLTVQPVRHGTLALMWDNKTIYIDPTGGAEAFEGLDNPNLILITDIHGDHLNVETLEAIETGNATIVAPRAVADRLPEKLKDKTVVLNNDDTKAFIGITITAIPMYNLPETEDSRHPKGRGNGYVLDMGGKRVYISGDTEDIPEMRALENIDIAFVCMNLPYTMNIHQAASAVLEFKPVVVYPFHYRGSDVEAFKQEVNDGNSEIEVRLKDWY